MRQETAAMFRILLVVAFALPAPANAASCADMVSQAEAWLADHPNVVGTEPQTVGAQLDHQPTRESVAKAKTESRDHLAASLAHAKAMQAAGDEAGCRKSFDAVAWMLKP
jgi:hypothetical protein